jgi:PAS domain S-box-containing protein
MLRTLIKTLFAALRLDLIYVSFDRQTADSTIREARSTMRLSLRRIEVALQEQWGEDSRRWPRSGSAQIGANRLSIATVPLTLARDTGVLVAASHRSRFPTKSESLVLGVAADQLLLAIHEYPGTRAKPAIFPNEGDFRILDDIPGMVAMFSAAGDTQFVNQGILDYFGGTQEEHHDWRGGERTHPEDTPRVVEAFRQSIESGQPFDLEIRARRFDGVYRWFRSRGTPITDASGCIVRWCNLLVDIDDRKRAQRALLLSERELSRTIDLLPTMVQVSRADGAVLSVNQAVLDYYGVSLDDMQRKGFRSRHYHPDDVKRLGAWREEALKHPVPFEYEQRALRTDGTYRWFLVRYNPWLNEQGSVERWYAGALDIDDRKRAEEALTVRERELREALVQLTVAQQVASMGSFTTDPNADKHTWSDEFYRICEFEPGSAPSLQRMQDIVHAEDLSLYKAVVEQSLAGKESTFEFRIVTPRSGVKHLRAATRLVQHGDGRPIFMGAVQDVSASKLAAEALTAREAELRRALNHLNEAQRLSKTGSVTADVIKNEHYWSDELYRIFEFEIGKEIKNPTLLEVCHPEDVPLFNTVLQRAFAGEEQEFEFRIVTRSGVLKHIRGFAHRIEHVSKQAAFVGAMQDVTAEKIVEQNLNRARSELAHVSRFMTLGTLSASIAHEINQPLSGIVINAETCLQMLQADPPKVDAARVQVQRILRDANRASEVIKRLRALFSRNQANSEPVDLVDAAREVLTLSASELQRQGVMVRTAFEDSVPPVRGDRVQLQQVILNLVLNAADAMSAIADRPRVLTVSSAREAGTHVRCSVSDTGVGLDGENVEKLFQAFHTTKSKGMGIGLSISRTIIENHEGRLRALPNEDGPGATFSFWIPCICQAGEQHTS